MSLIRQPDGSLRKENLEITSQIESDLIKFRTAMHRAETMLTLKDHPGWIAIQEILGEKLKSIEKSLDKFMDAEHRQNDLKMQERRDFKFFISIVEDFTGSIPGFEQKIEQCEKALSDRRKAVSPEL